MIQSVRSTLWGPKSGVTDCGQPEADRRIESTDDVPPLSVHCRTGLSSIVDRQLRSQLAMPKEEEQRGGTP